tara:strand:+ start:484 stop:630 length:147 start_codon:yes stop_codon:yes gene_type:complete
MREAPFSSFAETENTCWFAVPLAGEIDSRLVREEASPDNIVQVVMTRR